MGWSESLWSPRLSKDDSLGLLGVQRVHRVSEGIALYLLEAKDDVPIRRMMVLFLCHFSSTVYRKIVDGMS